MRYAHNAQDTFHLAEIGKQYFQLIHIVDLDLHLDRRRKIVPVHGRGNLQHRRTALRNGSHDIREQEVAVFRNDDTAGASVESGRLCKL